MTLCLADKTLCNLELEKKAGELTRFSVSLNLSLRQCRSERLSAVFKESYRKFCSLAALVWLPCHLPSLLWSADFFSTYRTLSHYNPFSNITYG